MCHNSSICQVYVLWTELGHCHFSAVGFDFCLATSLLASGATTVASESKYILYLKVISSKPKVIDTSS